MEPLTRATKFPNQWEVADIMQRYPGWLTALSEGTIENPEKLLTQEELLAEHFESAANSMGVYEQEGMPAKRYIKGHFKMCDPEMLETLRPVIDNKDDTAFAVLHHILAGGYLVELKGEIESSLHYQQLLSISYVDAAHLVRTFRMYAKGFAGVQIADPRVEPSALKQYLAIGRVIEAVQEITPREDWGIRSDDILRISDASLGNGKYTLRINDKELLSIAIDYADDIEPICRVMVDRKITSGQELRPLAESVFDSLRAGVPPALITGTL